MTILKVNAILLEQAGIVSVYSIMDGQTSGHCDNQNTYN